MGRLLETSNVSLLLHPRRDNLMKTLPYCIIPAGFFYNAQGATGKSLRIKACGRLGTTGAPTFTWSMRLLTSSTWSAAGIVSSTAALTAGTTQQVFREILLDGLFEIMGQPTVGQQAGVLSPQFLRPRSLPVAR